MSLLATLAPLGASYSLALTIAYNDDGTRATVTAFIKPKDTATKGLQQKTLQLEGTPAEVDEAIFTQLPAAVQQITKQTQSLTEQVAAQLAAEKEEADKKTAEKKTAAEKKPAPPAKPAPTPAAKKEKAAKPTPAKPADQVAADLAAAEKSTATEPAAPASETTPAPADPAKKQLSAAEQAVLDLANLDAETL